MEGRAAEKMIAGEFRAEPGGLGGGPVPPFAAKVVGVQASVCPDVRKTPPRGPIGREVYMSCPSRREGSLLSSRLFA